ncbi:MAG: glucose PTS transporter subunit IIA [Streptococcaceae bacterium]|jgi:PTS system arbutin-like IIC component|nr:glucose PTS transporter subunit IIA [Streptococcaceae bacterium]
MKEKLQKAAQNFSRAIIQPVMFMAVSGLVISIAAILKMEFMPEFLRKIGEFFFGIMTSGVIGSLSVIFAVGIAVATAKKKKTDAAIIAITSFMIYLYANNTWLTLTNRLAKAGEQGLYGTGQNTVLGIQVNDMGVFVGIMIGCTVGFLFNKLSGVKFHKYLQIYEGTKFAFLMTSFASIALGIIITYVWPFINSIISWLADIMATSGPFGLFLYGFFQKMLLPVGMHHLLWMPMFYTPLGGTEQVAGKAVSGAYNIWLAQLGDLSHLDSLSPSISFLTNLEPMVLPIAISLAFIKVARPENKAKVKAILIPIVILAFLAGVTEPLDFLYIFVAPLCFVVTAIMFGLGFAVSGLLNVRVMVGNFSETLPSLFVPMDLGHQYFLIPIMLGMGVITYFAFKFLILKLNYQTIGRGEMDEYEAEDTAKVSKDKEAGLSLIVKGLGGVENIKEIYNCFTRLRLDVSDEKKVDTNLLKKYPSSGVVENGKNFQIIIGPGVEELCENLKTFVDNLKSGKSVLVESNEIAARQTHAKSSGKQLIKLYSPAKGELLPIEEVPDEAFAKKTLGNGFAVKNHDGSIYSPVDGKIMTIFPTLHAIGIESPDGHQVMVHMGIDTVDLKGAPFTIKVTEGQEIRQGERLAVMDNQAIAAAGKDSMVIVVLLGSTEGKLTAETGAVTENQLVFEN